MRILVLGGAGFIGSHVVDRLRAEGLTVRVFDRRGEAYRAPLKSVEYVKGDFTDQMAVAEALTGVDIVFHLVSTTFPSTANLDPSADVRDNLIGTLNLIRMMTELQIKRLVYLSSGGTVYGPPETVPIPENHPLRPINSYGIVKVAVENYLKMFSVTHGLTALALRPSNPYGPRQAHIGVQGVVSTFLQRIQKGEAIEIWGDGSVVRDYLHVADLAEICVRAGLSEATGALNVGSGQGTALKEVLETILAVTGAAPEIRYQKSRAVDVPRSVLDVQKARDAFGWEAKMPLDQGISETWQWLQSLDG